MFRTFQQTQFWGHFFALFGQKWAYENILIQFNSVFYTYQVLTLSKISKKPNKTIMRKHVTEITRQTDLQTDRQSLHISYF